MAVGPYDFPSYLSAASVDGVAYGFEYSEELARTVPFISLVAQHAGPLAQAFEEFAAWAAATDPDSLEVTFVFRKKGGYLLMIAPEFSRLERRCLGFGRAQRAMTYSPVWAKPIDSIHPMLESFRKYRSNIIAPFLFCGATYSGPRNSLESSPAPSFSPLTKSTPLLKFEARLIDENDAVPNSLEWHALNLNGAQNTRDKARPPELNSDDIKSSRIRSLRHHFPVTLERMARSQWFSSMVQDLSHRGAHVWQIEQALCNLVLCQNLGMGLHFSGLSSRKLERAIVEALGSRFELADGGAIPRFSLDTIQTQIVADGNRLLRNLKAKPGTDLSTVQARLRSASALNARSALNRRF